MNIIHTSDWHIGQRLYSKEREEEHSAFFDWLLKTVTQTQTEVLLISGDIFDISYPSNTALSLYYKILTQLSLTCCKHIIITGGNHDSISTLNAPKELLNVLNIKVIGGATENISDEIIEIKNSENELQLVVCAVPFLRDKDLRDSKAGESYEDRTQAIRNGIINHYVTIANLCQNYIEKKIPVIAMGHLLAAGSSVSESEREIYIGNLGHINANQFPELFSYIALGHIHRPQIVAQNEHIRYSGSPIPLSFSEKDEQKYVILLNTENEKISTITKLEIPPYRKLIRAEGTLAEVVNILKKFQEGKVPHWAEVTIIEENATGDLVEQFTEIASTLKNVEILKLKVLQKNSLGSITNLVEEHETLADLEVKDVFFRLLEKNGKTEDTELSLIFSELLDSINEENL